MRFWELSIAYPNGGPNGGLQLNLPPPNSDLHLRHWVECVRLNEWFLVNPTTGTPFFPSLKVTNCSGERSFSIFKRIKNALNGRNVSAEVVHTEHSVH